MGGEYSDLNSISIHALREEGDLPKVLSSHTSREFLSTPSARRATYDSSCNGTWLLIFLSTPSARRATSITADTDANIRISIHALREEGDIQGIQNSVACDKFLSTPSARRATPAPLSMPRRKALFLSTPSARRATTPGRVVDKLVRISIHALREEGDTTSAT